MEAFLQFAGMSGSMGLPSLVVGTVLFLYFSIRKQEAVVRTEQLETIERLKIERDEEIQKNDEKDLRISELEKEKALESLQSTRYKIKILELGGTVE